ncbi:MAG: hypothetical protein ABR607_09030 [Pyrinomonadaceae bacterium]
MKSEPPAVAGGYKSESAYAGIRYLIMAVDLTEKEFSRHLNSTFQLKLEDHTLELKLVEVKSYMPGQNEQAGMERFSIYFDGPPDVPLPQKLYHLEHANMGGLDIFIVPIAGDEKTVRYEAVFNYFKK